jgi:hypothetical protein
LRSKWSGANPNSGSPWRKNLLALGFGINQDDLEQIFESAAEILCHLLLELGAGVARAALDRRDVVLGNAKVATQLTLRHPPFLTESAKASGAYLNPH